MQYMLLIYGNEAARAAAKPADMQQMFAAGDPLQGSSTATTVKVANGKTEVLNGPYADTKEQLGGYYLIEAADLDAALSWAARCPGASFGTMEVRPVMTM